ncbi:MAG: nucleotidyl transferase AbiEii/AbiGii toxin family protein [Candidatus Latescibacterota bacterium]
MQQLRPTPPAVLDALAAAVLARLQGHQAASHLVLGGGVALQHYCPYRPTVDVDGWWLDRARQETEALLDQVVRSLARERGLTYRRRTFGDTQSYELAAGGRTIFTVQVSVRSVAIDEPLPSAWPPVQIESFRDNLGAKMSALVGRGAPRDFTDVFEVCRRQLASEGDCWSLWRLKNPGQDATEAKARVLHHLEQLAARRPLADIPAGEERERAERLRAWVRRSLCVEEQP